jgi:hypothetical protein
MDPQGSTASDYDGDFKPTGTLAMEAVPCSAIPGFVRGQILYFDILAMLKYNI